jgi:D-methionine transport system substrate-binding protein
VKVGLTIASPMGLYSKKCKSFGDLPDPALLAMPNDPTNGARSLQILAAHCFIALRDATDVIASVVDIAANPRYRFIGLDAAQISRSLPDVDAAAINNNYAVQAGLDPVRTHLSKRPMTVPVLRSGKRIRTSPGWRNWSMPIIRMLSGISCSRASKSPMYRRGER